MNRHFKLLPLLLLLVALDLGSKYWITSEMTRSAPSITIIPDFFQLTLVHNKGAAFGIGTQWSMLFFVVTSVVALAVVGYLFFKLSPSEKFSAWGLVFIMAGAIGNLVDRVRLGYVVDFLDVYVGKHHWPAFNVADAAITIGAVLYGIDLIWPPKGKVTQS